MPLFVHVPLITVGCLFGGYHVPRLPRPDRCRRGCCSSYDLWQRATSPNRVHWSFVRTTTCASPTAVMGCWREEEWSHYFCHFPCYTLYVFCECRQRVEIALLEPCTVIVVSHIIKLPFILRVRLRSSHVGQSLLCLFAWRVCSSFAPDTRFWHLATLLNHFVGYSMCSSSFFHFGKTEGKSLREVWSGGNQAGLSNTRYYRGVDAKPRGRSTTFARTGGRSGEIVVQGPKVAEGHSPAAIRCEGSCGLDRASHQILRG